tara:strand:- start:3694 stop:3912 length:219 start_codon:yes stop_codon:yes gene_type:complete
MKEEIERKSEMEVVQGLLGMIQYMTNAINLETANVLHQLGYCKELIADNGCPVCKIEEAREQDAENDNEKQD